MRSWAAASLVGILCLFAAQAQEVLRLRPPAVPLVTHDPYFSIWSAADKLTDADTIHWSGTAQQLESRIIIDGKRFQLMGRGRAEVSPLPQVSVQVLPTRTIYTFEGAGLRVRFIFMTPALPEDMAVCSRPVTYVIWEAEATDGKEHKVVVESGASGTIAANEPTQIVAHSTESIPGLVAVRLGTVEQPVLAKKGDDLRIDWGYLYVAALQADKPEVSHFSLRDGKETANPGPASSVQAQFSFDLGKVGHMPTTRWCMLAYDDELSIRYFNGKLRPYWRRDGTDAAGLLQKAAADYTSLKSKCEQFDRELLNDLRRVGGEKYALLCALCYRQTIAGNKIVADAAGRPLMFPKENFSNGCIGTVDVLFPQAPFFLALSPGLTKAMLLPILDYSSSSRWRFNYAPHDLGTYPHATGQVYGGGENTDESQMPVEESGNMLIILAALAHLEGNADFSRPYWATLTKWAEYCVKEGLDPANQLCSADMFGHLPRCANLALKAIIAIGAYAQLCELTGKPEDSKKYATIARDFAGKWQELARDEGRTRLAYHLPGTWGMKHNLVWDRVLGTGLFPDSVGDVEVAWYSRVQHKYGLPVDNRTETSLIDWAVWSISVARTEPEFQALLEPLYRYVNETPTRVPLSDWFNTTDARQKGFQARPVVGGIFIKLLLDGSVWKKWSSRGADATGPWAPVPISAPLKTLLPTAQAAPVHWRYTFEKPADSWFQAEFDDSAWKEGVAGFGTKGTPGAMVRTEWNTTEIWLRREFTLPSHTFRNPALLMHYDEDPEVFINGVLAARQKGWTSNYGEVDLAAPAITALKPGKNIIAIHATQTYGGQYIDAGLIERSTTLSIRKVLDTPLRDTSICRGPDNVWYLTGTVQPFWDFNEGIKLWKSKDLSNWESLGMVWKYGGSPWHAKYLAARKPLWAPEVHYLKGNFWLTYSIPGWDGTGKTSGCGLLRSTSGRAEGPYEDMQPGERMGDEIDASLFEDDDGQVYFLWHSGKIARMRPDMSGLAEPYRWLKTNGTDPNPEHHSGLCKGIFGENSFDHVGYEGMFLFKANGRYYLSCAENFEGRYSCAIATAKSVYGPYGNRYEAIPHAGHNAFFKDQSGQWWSTYFGSDPGAPWQERAGILPIKIQGENVSPAEWNASSKEITGAARQ